MAGVAPPDVTKGRGRSGAVWIPAAGLWSSGIFSPLSWSPADPSGPALPEPGSLGACRFAPWEDGDRNAQEGEGARQVHRRPPTPWRSRPGARLTPFCGSAAPDEPLTLQVSFVLFVTVCHVRDSFLLPFHCELQEHSPRMKS